MTLQEFQSSFTPILNRWKRGYSGDQLELIYQEVKTLSRADFERVVANLLGSLRVSPMVPDFRKAVSEMGIRAIHSYQSTTPSNFQNTPEDFLYHVEDNVWANNSHVFIRGDKPSFVVMSEHPTHPLVTLAKEVRAERVEEIKKHLANNTYSLHIVSSNNRPVQTKVTNLRPINFEPEPA